MATTSSNIEAEAMEIASTVEPRETTTVGTETTTVETYVSSPNNDKSKPNSEEDDHSNDSENSGESEEEEEEEEEEDSKSDRGSIVDDGDSTDDQPEWGVDSFDEEEYWSPDEDFYPDEEEERKSRLYWRNVHFSHGFLVEEGIRPRQVWSGSVLLKSLMSKHSPVRGRTQLQYAQDMVKLSLRKYNALNGTDVKMDHVVRVTESFTGRWISYITFMAREEEDSSTLVEYQAKIVKKLKCKSYPIFCRPSPKLDLDM